jgi:hypothetical protein
MGTVAGELNGCLVANAAVGSGNESGFADK